MVQSSGFPTPMDCQQYQHSSDHAGHLDYQRLPANHKGALAAMVAELAKYAGGVTHSLVFTPHLEVFHTGKLLVPGIEIKMKFHFNGPSLFFNGVGLAGRLMEGDVKLRFHLCQLRLNDAIYQSLSSKKDTMKEKWLLTRPSAVKSGPSACKATWSALISPTCFKTEYLTD